MPSFLVTRTVSRLTNSPISAMAAKAKLIRTPSSALCAFPTVTMAFSLEQRIAWKPSYYKRRVPVTTKGGYQLLQKEGTSYQKLNVRITKNGESEILKKEGTIYFKRRVRVTSKGGYELLKKYKRMVRVTNKKGLRATTTIAVFAP